uniref:MABP domain-containing protein n=1 Tax=Angiostrongylus cantonensis TaxID=6313 RepID=A0A0K0DN69_ANGCA
MSTVFELLLYKTFQRKPIGRERVWPTLAVVAPAVSREEYTLEEDSVVQLDTRWAVAIYCSDKRTSANDTGKGSAIVPPVAGVSEDRDSGPAAKVNEVLEK